MIIIDPGISNTSSYNAFESGSRDNLWVKTPRGKNFLGKVWPGFVHFPDWFNPNASGWWEQSLREAHDIVSNILFLVLLYF
jgi:alpha-glucosidase